MSEETAISWTDHTFNPWSGCAKVSAGCAHCYAADLPPAMRRFAEWGANGTRIPASESYWKEPLKWARKAASAGERRRVFCASVADVFEDRADLDAHRERLWALIKATPGLDWLLLTKRPERMAAWAQSHDWPANAWAGTSVEDQRAADERIPHLLRVPARVRFLSCEPLLGPVDLSEWMAPSSDLLPGHHWAECLCLKIDPSDRPCLVCEIRGIHWVIVGGESGRHARPMHPDWARGLRDQCVAAGVAFHFKQWGEWAPVPDDDRPIPKGAMWLDSRGKLGSLTDHGMAVIVDNDGTWPSVADIDGDVFPMLRPGKHAAGRTLDGRIWDEFPTGAA